MIKLTTELVGLYNAYMGDSKWKEYTENFPEIPEDIISQLGIDADISRVLYWKLDNNLATTISWLQESVPALENKKPVDILTIEKGTTILRSLVTRM